MRPQTLRASLQFQRYCPSSRSDCRLGRAPARIAVTEQHATFTLEIVENGIFSKIAALTVGNRKTQDGSVPSGIGEWAVMSLDTDMNVLANKVKPPIANKGAWQKPRLA